MSGTTGFIHVFKQKTTPMNCSVEYLGHIFLQEGDRPSWNLRRGRTQYYWPCSKPSTIYQEGIIMAAIMLSQNEAVRVLTKEIYGNEQGLGVRSDHNKYPKLLKTIQETSEAYKFVIISPFVQIPHDLLEGINDLGVNVLITKDF